MGVPLNVTEWMKGYIGVGATDSDAGFIQGFDEGDAAYYEHEVVTEMSDIDKFFTALGPVNEAGKAPYAMGMLHIQTLDALKSVRSFASPGSGVVDTAKAIAKFGGFYFDELWKLWGVGHKSQRA